MVIFIVCVSLVYVGLAAAVICTLQPQLQFSPQLNTYYLRISMSSSLSLVVFSTSSYLPSPDQCILFNSSELYCTRSLLQYWTICVYYFYELLYIWVCRKTLRYIYERYFSYFAFVHIFNFNFHF